MAQHTDLQCACGKVQLQVEGEPILCAECHCESCRSAGGKLQALQLAQPLLEANSGTQYVLYRKDRVRFTAGTEQLKQHRLKPSSKTRRVLATCCNSAVFLDFEGGHWLSMYGRLWPEATRPRIALRTMLIDRADASSLPNDVPNAKRQSLSFFLKLLKAWASMRFKVPKIAIGREDLGI
jgi:hypothetical protein